MSARPGVFICGSHPRIDGLEGAVIIGEPRRNESLERLMDSYMDRTGRERRLRAGPVVGLVVCAILLAGCMTLLFQAMRGVLDLGGMVASGGPYAIEHPAPGWVWLFPVSIVTGMLAGFGCMLFQRRTGGPPLHLLAWPALFGSLGYNFIDYAFNPPGEGSGVVAAWLICGILFVGMGAAPLILVARTVRTRLGRPGFTPSGRSMQLLLLELAAVALGIWGGVAAFRALAG